MASLTGNRIADTYPGLLKTIDNAAIDGTSRIVTDGNGNATPINMSTSGVVISGSLTITGSLITTGGTALQGTASNAVSASYALTASVLLGSVTSASYAATASIANTATTAATASYVVTALTASYVTSSNVVGTVTSASYSVTASYALNTAASTPGGGNLSVQLNNANATFTGSQNLVWDPTNTYLVNSGYYVLDYGLTGGVGLLGRTGTPVTNSFQVAFSNQAQYGGTINTFSGRQLAFYDFQAAGLTAYRAGINEAGDFFIGNSSINYSAKFQQPTQSTNVPLTLKGASGQTADLLRVTDNNNTSVLFVSASGLTSGSFKGNLTGTASFASTASFVNSLQQAVQLTGSLNISGSVTLSATSSLIIPLTASATPATGQVYFDFTSNKLHAYNGTSWVTASLG